MGCRIREAVVTVPAYFGEAQRRATQDAAKIAGLHVERIINEPTAAALAYGLHHREREFRAAVLDLGGGTFDVTVLEVLEGVIEIQASAGDTRLGGEDFTTALVELAKGRLRIDYGIELAADASGEAKLREAMERAKCQLSTTESLPVALYEVGGRDPSWTLSRAEAERAWAPLLSKLVVPLGQAQRDAGATPQDVDEVILVGGATRMPVVRELAAKFFGRLPLTGLHPDEAVSLGAAIQAALKDHDEAVGDSVVTDVAPFSLGIAASTQFGQQLVSGLFAPILERGTVLPASRSQVFSTVYDGQKRINVEIFQGEHSLCRENRKLGEYNVSVPKAPAGDQAIEIRFTYDLNGVLEVESTVASTGKTASIVLENGSGRLSKRELAAAVQKMQSLKFNPRESLPNVTALKRADARFQATTGVERERIGQLSSQLRAASETQDPALIEEARAILNHTLAELR